MTTANLKTPLEMLAHWEHKNPDKVYFEQPLNGQWTEYTWGRVADEVRRVAAYIDAQNFPKGSHIALMSKNCAQWIITDLAIWMAGHVSIPLYPNLTADVVAQIIEHSESKMVFAGKLDNFHSMKAGLPTDLPTVSFPYDIPGTEEYTKWDEVLKTEPLKDAPKRDLEEVATIIYTSGTTGAPKGVVHKFKSFAFAGTNGVEALHATEDERFFSYLPLSHVAERLIVETASLYSGGKIYFAESLDTFPANLKYASPTIFLAVPRIWTKFQLGILGKLPQKKLNLLLKLPIISGLIKNKVLTGLGLQSCRLAFTGAAPIPVSSLEWFKKLGLEILEAYGMTENFAYSHISLPGHVTFGRVGQPLPHVDVQFADDEEIQVKSIATMVGYYKETEKTAETMNGDFLKTGDQGNAANDGNLKITGRVKDLFKTSKGKYVAPSPIELKLSKDNNIEQVCVVGVGLPQPIALTVLSDLGKGLDQTDLDNTFETLLKSINPTLDHHERLTTIVVMGEDWTIENKILTPTMKIKRSVLENKYKENFEVWYEASAPVVWAKR
ncbi:MAG: AMP-binding protein [Halobacteriovoraceae bacterium]|jgi:long-chain acyl-CoA synthetase|nr:AMP-binding protein [Halobacteriovoraceae bacterium]